MVPAPGVDVTSSVPPCAATRSAMFVNPIPWGVRPLLAVSLDAGGRHLQRDGGLPGLGLKGRLQPLQRKQGRVDAPGQIPQGVQGIVGVGLQLGEHGPEALGVAIEHPFGQPELHRQGHQLLLGAVVDVALQPTPSGVLGRHDAPAGVLELFDQPDVAEHQPGLQREVPQELLLRRREVRVRLGADADGPQELSPMPDGEGQVASGEPREVVPGDPDRTVLGDDEARVRGGRPDVDMDASVGGSPGGWGNGATAR